MLINQTAEKCCETQRRVIAMAREAGSPETQQQKPSFVITRSLGPGRGIIVNPRPGLVIGILPPASQSSRRRSKTPP